MFRGGNGGAWRQHLISALRLSRLPRVRWRLARNTGLRGLIFRVGNGYGCGKLSGK